jgi:hypothetical protein
MLKVIFSKIEKNLLNSKITIDETEINNKLNLKETYITQTLEEEDNKSKNQEEECESLIQSNSKPKNFSQNLNNDPRFMTFKKETTIQYAEEKSFHYSRSRRAAGIVLRQAGSTLSRQLQRDPQPA